MPPVGCVRNPLVQASSALASGGITGSTSMWISSQPCLPAVSRISASAARLALALICWLAATPGPALTVAEKKPALSDSVERKRPFRIAEKSEKNRFKIIMIIPGMVIA